MLVCYTHRLGVIDDAALKSLFYQKVSEKISKTEKLPEETKQQLLQKLSEGSKEANNINFSTTLKLDYHDICRLLENITDELQSSNLFQCVKDTLKTEIETKKLTLGKALSTIEKIYAGTLLDKGKTLIKNCNYGFNPVTIKETLQKAAHHEVGEDIKKMPLSFNMQYFTLEHGSRKLIEPHILQEMFLLRYFSTLKTYEEANILKDETVKEAFKAYV